MKPSRAVSTLLCATSLAAQGPTTPDLLVQPHAHRVGASTALSWNITGTPGSLYALFADPQPGPSQVLGARVNLGLSNELITVQVGILSPVGFAGGATGFSPPLSMAGTPIYIQHVEGDPNNLSTVTAGVPESIAFHSGRRAIVEDFRAQGQRWTGTFDPTAAFRLQGAPATRRTQRTDGGGAGAPFTSGIRNPLNPSGSRVQMVFRPQDVGATGRPEILTSISWLNRGQVIPETLANVTLTASHTQVIPDYTLDPLTGLPNAPGSGLSSTFANNPSGAAVVLMASSYPIRPQDQTPAGFLPYPLTGAFGYDGVSSLLLDIEVAPSTPARTAMNGQWGRLMVTSSPNPAARVFAEGSPSSPLQPGTANGSGDNFLYEYELEFLALTSEALSPWFTGGVGADYMTPVIGSIVPAGTSFSLEYRGADDAQGTNPTAWGATQDLADGRPFLQVRVTFNSNATTGMSPSIDTLVIPIQ